MSGRTRPNAFIGPRLSDILLGNARTLIATALCTASPIGVYVPASTSISHQRVFRETVTLARSSAPLRRCREILGRTLRSWPQNRSCLSGIPWFSLHDGDSNPPPLEVPFTFSSVRSVCWRTSPPASSPVFGSSATCPARNRNPFARMAPVNMVRWVLAPGQSESRLSCCGLLHRMGSFAAGGFSVTCERHSALLASL